MNTPLVSFVVPCYRLAHLLPECINSILSQTFRDFEILIMDDCSPDNTPEVVDSFHDDRVRHIRNNPNLGHLRNYNKGISLSRGKYIWLISADDYLRRPYILQRYVELMERHPRVGYTFCPGIGVRNGQETDVLEYSVCGRRDRILDGHMFLKTLLQNNRVVAASAMARRECYERVSAFPLEDAMKWSGDWYLWCVFALHFDVGYFCEPMVCYREHDLSMTSTLTREENVHICVSGDIAVPWMVRQKAKQLGAQRVASYCTLAVAQQYAKHSATKQFGASACSMNMDQVEASLRESTCDERDRDWIRARVFAGIGDHLCFRGDSVSASTLYLRALRKDPRMAKVYAKLLLVWLGKPGHHVRKHINMVRRNLSLLVTTLCNLAVI
jgi:hypothetical protein